MEILNAELVLDHKAELGEGAIWDPCVSKLWWVDISQGHLHRFDPVTKINETFDVGFPVSTVVPEDGGGVVLALENGFASYDTNSGELEMLGTVEHDNPSVRFNDGKCDSAGRFWVGTLAEDGTVGVGALYCMGSDLTLSKKIEGVSISNGLGWSPSGEKMYHIDTHTQRVMEYKYDMKSGGISSPRVVVEIEEGEGAPDGMCVDSEGMLWVAIWDGGKVIQINPGCGERLSEVRVPGVSKVTSCALGGYDLKTLFITTAREGLAEEGGGSEPSAGGLFATQVKVGGLLVNQFKRV